MSKSTSLGRVLSIIDRLNNGKKLNITNLSYDYNVSTRTIRRDIELIEQNLNEGFLQKDGENIYAVDKSMFENIMGGKEVASLIHIFNVFNQSGFNLEIPDNMKKKVKKSAEVYDIKNKPLELLQKTSELAILEKAIRNSREVKIKYKTPSKIKMLNYRPYKITMLNENFYLLGLNDEGKYYSLRINMIQEVEMSPKTFYKSAEMINFVKDIQTPFATFGEEKIEVRLKVDAEVARYFKMKKFFASQKIEKEEEDGSLEMTYQITNYKELEGFIIQWLPNIHILSPEGFRKNVLKELQRKTLSI